MKHYLFLTALICFSFLVQAQKGKQEPYLTRSLANEGIKNVEVETSGGSISVTGVNASEARIEVYVNKNNNRDNESLSKEEIKSRLDEGYDLTISVSGGKVTAKDKPKHRDMDWKRALSISFKLFVPQNVSSELETSGGSIHLENLTGSQDFSTSGGSLHMEKLSGKIKGRTSGGSIHIENSRDDISLETSGGSIHLNNLNGNIRANTSGGSIRGKNIEGELNTNTSGGSIVLTDLACSLETSTSGGHIDVSMKELGKYVRISNSGGNIDLELPASKGLDLKLRAHNIKRGNLANFSGTMEDDEIEGKLNGGGIPVTVRAGSGRINLSVR